MEKEIFPHDKLVEAAKQANAEQRKVFYSQPKSIIEENKNTWTHTTVGKNRALLTPNGLTIYPNTIAEVGELFDEKFDYKNVKYQPDGFSILLDKKDGEPASAEQIKQFWLEHFKSLLEGMRMEEIGQNVIINRVVNKDVERVGKCFGYNQAVSKINKHLDNLLSKGEI